MDKNEGALLYKPRRKLIPVSRKPGQRHSELRQQKNKLMAALNMKSGKQFRKWLKGERRKVRENKPNTV